MGEAHPQDLLYEVHMVDVLPRAYFFRGKQVAFILDDLLDSGLPK